MVELQTSNVALAATMPPVAEPSDSVEVRLLYDPFRPETVEKHELEFADGQTLADYLGDLPSEGEYLLFHNGEEVEFESAGEIAVGRGDGIGLIVLPQGGKGLKSVLRVVMQVAMIGVMFIPGIGQIAAAAISLGLGLISAFLLTPKAPKGQDQEERSYGIDGAKNSATEGIPYPIVYGEFRSAGNYANTYTENVGDDQYLYLRTVLNDGEIDSISATEINEQPVENFKDVQTRLTKGTLSEDVNDWFRSSIRQVNKGIKIDQTWTTHITTQVVDQVRFDVAFPAGLVSISEKKGTYRSKSVTFEMEYRRVQQNPTTGNWEPVAGTAGNWDVVPHDNPSGDYLNEDRDTHFAGSIFDAKRAKVAASAPTNIVTQDAAPPPKVEYREVGAPSWNLAYELDVPSGKQGYVPDASGDGSISGPTNITPLINGEAEIALDPSKTYEFRGTGGAIVDRIVAYPESGRASATITDRRTRAIRRSITSARLARGHYEVRIRRTNAQATSQYEIDECVLTDIAEIEADPVAMRGTATLSLRIKLNEQLNQIPQLTTKVKGSILQEYDRDGNPTVRRWSANPAWIGLDILCGAERGAGIATSRIDWPRWVEFAEWCDANGIQFNGVFAEGTNIGDALRQVLRVGRAAPVPFGTRYSVAIDRPRDPVAMFTKASMVAKSFSITYMSMQDRSNEFEVTYYDRGDRNKAKTIRYVDPKAVTFNEMPRSSTIPLVGVDNLAQAKGELWRAIYQNRLIIRQVQFDTFMEAINLNIGEVALIQHDQMQWANNGRLKDGNTPTVINLDQPVEFEAGTPYAALVHFSAISRLGPRAVSSVVGKRVLVAANGSALTADNMKADRLVCSNGEDIEIAKMESGATFHTITLVSAPVAINSTHTVELFQTDAVEERGVEGVVTSSDGTCSLTLSEALPDAPDQFASFVFGKVELVRKPYVLTGVSGNGVEKRKLTFMEYHEGVYAPPEVDIPIPVAQVNNRTVPHVTGLLFDYERVVSANRKTVNVRLFWAADAIRNYGGADVYMRLNGSEWTAAGSAPNVTEFAMQLAPDDEVEFRVVAYSTQGDRAPSTTSPSVSGTLTVQRATLDAPTAFSAVPTHFEVEGTVAYAWTPPADASGVEGYEVEVRGSSDLKWFGLGRFTTPGHVQTGIPAGSYVARVRSISTDSISEWVEATFTVVALPGSLLSNFNNGNDRNATPIPAPTLPPVDAIEHTLNTDGSANVSLEWLWSGDEATIDGFQIRVTQA